MSDGGRHEDPSVRMALVEVKLDNQGREIGEIKENICKMTEYMQKLTETVIRMESIAVTQEKFNKEMAKFIQNTQTIDKRIDDVKEELTKDITNSSTRIDAIYTGLKLTWIGLTVFLALLGVWAAFCS